MGVLLGVIGILLAGNLLLLGKVVSLRKAARELAAGFREKLETDTNTLLTLSTRDAAMRQLASEINGQLRLLRQARHRYQQGDRELKEAVTNISHDLRTPLTAMRGYLDLLSREEKSQTVARYLSQLQAGTETLTALTEELFRYSVVTSTQTLQPERLDMVRALEESLLSFYAAMREKGIEPEVQLPEGPVWRQLDAGALRRIFSNVISNALKYSDGDLSVCLDETGQLTFRNTARCLNAVAVGQLLDRFYTVKSSRNATGLGLSITKTLTERMGGRLAVSYEDEHLQIVLAFDETDTTPQSPS